ncbi:hypothetical protein PtA15_3A875 [Puccinia triticina]|uniref:Uncharacterized protein n=1 Tax=Puccinia triticina TaxID=208348 RepID=A0ABY7CE73_9BASI|nr:uncharacterized protein PtA15_3A875 [Puccinia triticina]WAQ83504.1 hypothetical protein PtA15_3A875 [Puccinia triticina]
MPHTKKINPTRALDPAAEIQEANQTNNDESSYVDPARAPSPPAIENLASEQVCPPKMAWAPYAGIAHVPNEIIHGENNMIGGAGSQFSEEISDLDYSPSEARSVLLSDLDSDNEADGEGWEMDPGDLRAMVEAVVPSLKENPPQGLPDAPPARKHWQTDKSWWPFCSKQVSLRAFFKIDGN